MGQHEAHRNRWPIETARLVLRPFAASDWNGLQALAVDKETLRRDPNDPPWPTSEDGCRGLVQYLAERPEQYSAVVLKGSRTLIGLLAFNHTDDDGRLELGYQILSAYQDMVHDQEALDAIIEHAFAVRGARSIDSRTNAEWAEQVAPLVALGFRPIDGDGGHLGITKQRWEERAGTPD